METHRSWNPHTAGRVSNGATTSENITTVPQKETGTIQLSNPTPRNENTGPHKSCTSMLTAALQITKRVGKDNQQINE